MPERTLRLSLTWGLGGTALVLVFLLLGTGLMLKFVYEPFPDKAYESILYLNNNVPFGQLTRNIHWLSANSLIFVVFLHLLRVFYTGAFTAPRQLNWIIGLAAFAAVVLSNYTGYLLPWDQISWNQRRVHRIHPQTWQIFFRYPFQMQHKPQRPSDQ